MNMKTAPINRLYFKFCESLISTPRGIWISSPHLPPEDSLCDACSLSLSLFLFFCLCFSLLCSSILSSTQPFPLLLSKCRLSRVSKLYSFLFATINKLHKRSNKHTQWWNNDAPATNTKGEKCLKSEINPLSPLNREQSRVCMTLCVCVCVFRHLCVLSRIAVSVWEVSGPSIS